MRDENVAKKSLPEEPIVVLEKKVSTMEVEITDLHQRIGHLLDRIIALETKVNT